MFTKADFSEERSTFAGTLLVHSIAAMLGSGFCAAFAAVLIARAVGLDPASSNSNLCLWYSPLIWCSGLLLGVIVNWRVRDSAACMTWVSGAALLGLLMADLLLATGDWDRMAADIFPLSQAESSPDDVLGVTQLFFVWPAINSFAYSLGASIPLLFGSPTTAGWTRPSGCQCQVGAHTCPDALACPVCTESSLNYLLIEGDHIVLCTRCDTLYSVASGRAVLID